MSSLDVVQKKLIHGAERPHYEGIRHAGLSGTICEDLLLKALRNSLKSSRLSFARGVTKYTGRNKKGNALKSKEMSSQMDVIVYEGQPDYRTGSHVVVHVSQVRGVLEIKKWAYRKEMQESFKNKVMGLRIDLRASSGRHIPVFLVTFRFRDQEKF